MKSLNKSFSPSLLAGLLLAGVLLATSAFAQARPELLARSAGDLAPTTLAAPSVPGALPGVESAPVSFSRSLAADAEIELAPEPFTSHSREYWFEATAEQLENGLPIDTTAPGALVRLNPIVVPEGTDLALDPRLLVLEAGGTAYRSGLGMELLATAEQLQAAGSPFAEGTVAFRIRQDLGTGRVVLRSEGLGAPAETRFLVNVFEPASPIELTLGADRANYLHGDVLTVEATLLSGAKALALETIEGFVTSPAGRSWPVSFVAGREGAYRASLALDADEAFAPGLWEVQVATRARADGQDVLRGARTAFAVALPTARLDGRVEVRMARARQGEVPASIRFGLEVAVAGRYEVSGLLYGTDAAGQLRPMAALAAAAVRETGRGEQEIVIDPTIADDTQLSAPFELRGLRLVDQSRMAVLHQQARALVLR